MLKAVCRKRQTAFVYIVRLFSSQHCATEKVVERDFIKLGEAAPIGDAGVQGDEVHAIDFLAALAGVSKP